MKEIELTKGKVAIVDDCDYGYLIKFNWYLSSNGYAARTGRSQSGEDPRGIYHMHRMIVGCPLSTFEVDHLNGNRLDNRNQNLRACTKSQNLLNQVSKKKYKGVGRRGERKKNPGTYGWTANFRGKYLGSFNSEIEAALAYNEAAKAYDPIFCRLNVIQ